jgi:hypothetical protein
MFVEAKEHFVDPVYFGIDAAKFDMHVTEKVLRLEHSVYLHMYKNDPLLSRLLDWQIDNVGNGVVSDGSLHFKIKGTRFSGDINTSLGNVMIMVNLISSYFDNQKIDYRLINNGDDAYVVCERKNAHVVKGFVPHAVTCGFRIELEDPVYELEHVRFCQMAPIEYEPGKYVMVRDPKNLLQKDIMSFHDLSKKTIREKWMYAVGYGGLAMYGNIPVLRDFYNYYHKTGNPNSNMLSGDREIQNSAYFYWGRGLIPEYRHIHPICRLSYFKAFNVTPDEQVAWEKHYSEFSSKYDIEPTDEEGYELL